MYSEIGSKSFEGASKGDECLESGALAVHPEEKARMSFMPSLEEVQFGESESFTKTTTRVRMRVACFLCRYML